MEIPPQGDIKEKEAKPAQKPLDLGQGLAGSQWVLGAGQHPASGDFFVIKQLSAHVAISLNAVWSLEQLPWDPEGWLLPSDPASCSSCPFLSTPQWGSPLGALSHH